MGERGVCALGERGRTTRAIHDCIVLLWRVRTGV
jgi:hypothetical protein